MSRRLWSCVSAVSGVVIIVLAIQRNDDSAWSAVSLVSGCIILVFSLERMTSPVGGK